MDVEARRAGPRLGGPFALSAVGYRGAALALPDTAFIMAAASPCFARMPADRAARRLAARARSAEWSHVLRAWRISLFAGFMGAAASAGWLTAFAIEPVAHVRTLGLVELVFSYAVARRFFLEKLSRLELAGIALIAAGIAVILKA